MIAPEIYNPEQWKDFFVLVGTGSATLAGLVFIAMTINLHAVTQDGTHRYRAINMLSGFTSVFIISALVLMGGQTYHAVALEWLLISLFATIVNTNGYVQAFKHQSSLYALSKFRIIGGSTCYIGQLICSLVLYFGTRAGIYIAAVALIINFYFFVSGAWLLIMGTLHNPE